MASRKPSKKTRRTTGRSRTESYSRKPSRAPTPPGLQAGEILGGRWRLLRELGAGGMGGVWEAEHVRNGRRVALKVLHETLSRNPLEREYFLREGLSDNVAAPRRRPAGPGSVEVYDDGYTADGRPFFVMEALDGPSVDKLVRGGRRLDPVAALGVVRDAAIGLEPAHARGIIHRDLKPENLFLETDGDLRVLDFGLAQYPDDPPVQLGGFVGTPTYAPPEQAIGLRSDPSSDVFGLGATAYRLLAGRAPLPVDRDDVNGPGTRYLRGLPPDYYGEVITGAAVPTFETFEGCPVPPVRTFAPEVPEHVARVVDQAVSCDPAARQHSLAEFRADVEEAIRRELDRQTARLAATASPMHTQSLNGFW